MVQLLGGSQSEKMERPHLLVIYHSPHVAIDPRYTFELFERDDPVPSSFYRPINLIKETRECLLTLHIVQVIVLLVPPEVPGAVELVLVRHRVGIGRGPR